MAKMAMPLIIVQTFSGYVSSKQDFFVKFHYLYDDNSTEARYVRALMSYLFVGLINWGQKHFCSCSFCVDGPGQNCSSLMNKQLSVLLVEDDEHIRRILQYNLKLDGFDVLVAENGSTALKLAAALMPDLLLLDWMMPGKEGLGGL